MKSLVRRLPEYKQVQVVFLAVVFPIHFWALIFFLRELPSYLMRMRTWDILGVLAYTQVVALLDSLLLFAALMLLVLLLPISWLRDHFASIGALLGIAAILVVIPFHLLGALPGSISPLERPWLGWLWFALVTALFLALSWYSMHSLRFEALLQKFFDKLGVVSTFYLTLSLMGIVVLVSRNLGLR